MGLGSRVWGLEFWRLAFVRQDPGIACAGRYGQRFCLDFTGQSVLAVAQMKHPSPTHDSARTWRLLGRAVGVLAGLLLLLWVWIAICQFPNVPWNDMRLAPSVALARGLQVYASAESGTINTWVYGPLPLLFYLPAALAPTAASALLVAGGLTAALVLVPVVVVCLGWPAAPAGTDDRSRRVVAAVLALAAWPALYFTTLFSDTLAIALGLGANLVLVRARAGWQLWLAAAAASAAVACKQIALGIPLAQAVWLGVTLGWRAGVMHALRCAVTGAGLLLAAIAVFGATELRFMLIDLVSGYGWVASLATRLRATGWALPIHVGIPLATMLLAWRHRRRFASTMGLPCLAWLCTLPAGFAGLLYGGGWTNSFYSFVLWLPPAAATLLTLSGNPRHQAVLVLGSAAAAAAILSFRLASLPAPSVLPQLEARQQAAMLAARNPGQVWFPLQPLVTLYSDGRYYHDEDGLWVRFLGRKPPGVAHLQGGLPPAMRMMAFSNDWNDWGYARTLLPPHTRTIVLKHWTVIEGVAGEPGK